MPVIDIGDLPRHMPPASTVAAIDIGTKTIGLAVSDRSLAFAHPRPVIMRRKFTIDAETLLAALAKDGVSVLVAGLPINMDGSQGPRAQASRAFVRNLQRMSDMPMAFWDERLSTVAAERALLEMDVSRGKRGERIDSAAAAFILQGVLDRLHVMARQP